MEDGDNMENILFFITGMLLSYLILQRPLQITIHHKNENVVPPIAGLDMDTLEEKMLKADPKKDEMYKNFEEAMLEVNEVMGGSDR